MADKRTKESKSVSVSLAALDAIKTLFTKGTDKQKLELLKRLRASTITDPEEIQHYHDLLCFLRVYAGNSTLLKESEKQLKHFGARVELYQAATRDRKAKKLVDSGIEGTTVEGLFSYELTRFLCRRYGEALTIDWKRYDKEGADPLVTVLPQLVAWPELDTFDNDKELDTRKWLQSAQGKTSQNELGALLLLFENSKLSREMQRYLFDQLDLGILWTLTNSPASRTLKRVAGPGTHYQKEGLKGRSADLRAELDKAPTDLTLVSAKVGQQYVDDIKEALGVRIRELFSLTGANPNEVYINDPGRGLRIVIYGSNPGIRLPLESNFGAMLIRNNIPIGYGVCATLFDRAEIAINVFPAFRSGESAFIIEQFFRLFHHHFGAQTLFVRSYQIGDNNDEALESGSFWFYYKLGFRSVQPNVRLLAEKEYKRIIEGKGYRSPIRMLKRLAISDMFFSIDPQQMSSYQELLVSNLGKAVTRHISEHYEGNRQRMISESVKILAQLLALRNISRWSADEKVGFERIAPLISSIPELGNWSPADKKLLAKIIRAKGGLSEREFVLLCNRHERLKSSLTKLAEASA
ncbi:MAG: hypothetical protein SGI97_10250 [candidate division Zixibacteria bacterium]|nr:hypothetical protein [candidate division Zixibacteria bacterium]